ncbi:MAG: bifunctional UDP-sugar hydrolase/5'-nucleotidase [Chloroherpetonaceae bacterium]|nr:bifunctional UDP-sugar hydrolase/5'-nucleotidase [Chloroherpetonaceae bacterium]
MRKSLLIRLLLLYIISLASSCSSTKVGDMPNQIPSKAQIKLETETIATLRILHFNDFHAQNLPYTDRNRETGKTELVGGMAYMKTLIDSLRSFSPYPTMLLNAGDNFQGTPISTFTKGLSSVYILNALIPDVVTVGNHEFDYGYLSYRNLLDTYGYFSTVCANLVFAFTGEPVFPPYSVHDLGGIKVAIIGLITTDLPTVSMPYNIVGLGVLPYEKALDELLPEIQSVHKPDAIIILSHIGVTEDIKLAKKYPQITAFIGGHSHTPIFKPIGENHSPVVQAGSKGKYLGQLDLKIDLKNDSLLGFEGKLIPILTDSLNPHPTLSKFIDSLEAPIELKLSEKIGILKTDFTRRGNGPSNVGNWLAMVYRKGTNADLGVQNAGGIRRDLVSGDIRLKDIYELVPFGNDVVKMLVTGKELVSMLQWQLQGKGSYCDFEGLICEIDTIGNKSDVYIVSVNGKPFSETATYSIATNAYVHTQHKSLFGLDAKPEFQSTPFVDTDFIVDFVRKNPMVDAQVSFWGIQRVTKPLPILTPKKNLKK